MNDDSADTTLPAWFVRPSPIPMWQESLFKIHLEEALVYLQISPDELNRWHTKGWVSFDASTSLELNELDDPRAWELIFVRDIVRSGLSDAQIAALFAQVEKPFAFDPERIAFSFRHGWVEVAEEDSPDPYEVIEQHLDSWVADCDEETLRDLLAQITEALEPFENIDAEDGA